MKTLIAIVLASVLCVGTAQAAQQETRITTINQNIKYDANGPEGRQLISVERQVIQKGHTDNMGKFQAQSTTNRSVATMIPLEGR